MQCNTLQASALVTLRDLLEMYGIAAAGAAYQEKAIDRDMRNLLQMSPPFAEARLPCGINASSTPIT